MTRTFVLLAVVLTLAIGASAQRNAPAAAAPALKVTGDVATPLTLAAPDLKAMPRTRVEIREDARTVVYEGVLVAEILKRAGVPLGADLRGSALASYVVAGATDGYQVVFSVGELDPALSAHEIIVADSVDGQPLFAYQGAFRLVVPRDTRAARSVRMLEQLAVIRVKK